MTDWTPPEFDESEFSWGITDLGMDELLARASNVAIAQELNNLADWFSQHASKAHVAPLLREAARRLV